MCNLCGGTHVVHTENGYAAGFHTCPNCGHMTAPEWQEYMNMVDQKILAAEIIFVGKGA